MVNIKIQACKQIHSEASQEDPRLEAGEAKAKTRVTVPVNHGIYFLPFGAELCKECHPHAVTYSDNSSEVTNNLILNDCFSQKSCSRESAP
jgi:hypothetical protein